MKRALTVAAALLMCASSALAQDKDKKDNREKVRPPAAQPSAKPQPQRPAFNPAARTAPQPQVQPRPQDQARPMLQPRPQFQPKPDRADRPVRPGQSDRPVRPERGDQPQRPIAPARPDTGASPGPQGRPSRPAPRPNASIPNGKTPRPARTARPNPAAGGKPRPRPPHSALPTRPARVTHPTRGASPQAIAHTRQIRQTLRANRVRTYSYRGRTLRAVRARPYAYPAGWRYRAWRRHERFPAELFLAAFFLNNFGTYGLSAPPPGYYWVRYGPDAVLVNRGSYDIADTAYGVFDDGSGYGGGYADDADLPALDPDLPGEFASGELDLAAGNDQSEACDFFYGDRQTQDDIDQAWADQDWNGLAKTVAWAGCGNDISYYLLGLAAEGLALPDAAGSYYGRAVEMADGNVDSTFKCASAGSDSCRGMDIGQEASDGLDRIYGPQN